MVQDSSGVLGSGVRTQKDPWSYSPLLTASLTLWGSPCCAHRAVRVQDGKNLEHRALSWHTCTLGNAKPGCAQTMGTALAAQTK